MESLPLKYMCVQHISIKMTEEERRVAAVSEATEKLRKPEIRTATVMAEKGTRILKRNKTYDYRVRKNTTLKFL
jgi:hypothetical protein